MKNAWFYIAIIAVIGFFSSCQSEKESALLKEKIWKLGWRMTENFWAERYELAELQFDSLLSTKDKLEDKFLMTGLELKSRFSKTDEIEAILKGQSLERLTKVCQKDFAQKLKLCKSIPLEEAQNQALQREIIKMYVDDQAARRNLMKHIIEKYDLDSTEVSQENTTWVDEVNRERLKEIIEEFGFPTLKLIGTDAMQGVFLIIQHSDSDVEWQKSQLPNIESAVRNGDLPPQKYAYVFDRIQVNTKQAQRYGTQFSNVDLQNKIVELRDTEDLSLLDTRRREMGMMPIEVYKRIMLRNSLKRKKN